MFLQNSTKELLIIILGNEPHKHLKQVRVQKGISGFPKRTTERHRAVNEQHSPNTVRGWMGEVMRTTSAHLG